MKLSGLNNNGNDMQEFKKQALDLLELCVKGIKQHSDGSFVSGNNGPHGDKETEVQTTSHMLHALCTLIEHGYEQYRLSANSAADFLLSEKARPMNASFWCRMNPHKDFCNGLVGQAWVIESLFKAAKVLNRQDCFNISRDVLEQHYWNERHKAWHTLNVDGSNGQICQTFNQQLWFASLALDLEDTSPAFKHAIDFVQHVLPRVELYDDGVIYHDSVAYIKIYGPLSTSNLVDKLKLLKKKKKMEIQRLRSVGYHGFNLIALKKIREILPSEKFWNSGKFNKISDVVKSKLFKSELLDNKFAYPYNQSGFEIAYFLKDCVKDENYLYYVKKNLDHISEEKGILTVKQSMDKINSVARIYEIGRLL